jgi:predicted HAD superfamily Cof-like phosphohydrolase
MSADSIELWHKRARPEPTSKAFNVQHGVHFEEIAEMMDCLLGYDEAADALLERVHGAVTDLANELKAGVAAVAVPPEQRKEFLDSLADQVVTAIGVGHCAGMKTADAIGAVNSSNWSKYDADGNPILNANGKIAKGPNYAAPLLEGMY